MSNNKVIQEEKIENLPPPYKIMHIFKRSEGYFSKMHSHENYYHINYVESGEVCVTFKDVEYVLQQGQAIILPPRIPHSIYSKTGYSQIGIDMLEMDDKRGIYDLFCQTYPTGFAVITLTGFTKSYNELLKAFRSIDGNHLSYLKIINAVETLLLTIIERSQNVKNPNLAQRFVDFMKKEHALSFSLEKICRNLEISKTHLERIIKKEFGYGVIEYRNKMKLSKACLLLRNTDLPVKIIGENLYFYDPSHFNYFFKQRMGMTPMQYRIKSRNDESTLNDI